MSENEKQGEAAAINAASITDRVKLLAAEVCRDEMSRCINGHEHASRIDNLERRADEMQTSIKDTQTAINDGLSKIYEKLEKRDEKKENNVWTIFQIILTAALGALVAWKWH